ESFDQLGTLHVHTETIKELIYLHDGKHVVSVGNDGKLNKVNTETGVIREFNSALGKKIKSVTYLFDGTTIYAASENSLHGFDINTLDQIENSRISFNDEIVKVIYIRETHKLAVGLKNGQVLVVCPEKKVVVGELNNH